MLGLNDTMRLKMDNGDCIAIKVQKGLEHPSKWLIWLHGGGSSKDNERAEAVKKLAQVLGVSFLAFDAREGDGKSTRVKDELFDRWVQDYEFVTNKACKKASSIVLMGHSQGARAAAWAAARQKIQAPVAGLVMFSAAFGQYERRVEQLGGPEKAQECLQGKSMEIVRRGEQKIITPASLQSEFTFNDAALIQAGLELPTWIFHGAQDETVDLRYAVNFCAQCRSNVSLLIRGGIDHRFKGQESQIIFSARPFIEGVLGI